jgi:hypothetical protein
MTRFFHWRKMTWALLLWSGGIAGWALYSIAGRSNECVANFGPNSEFITRQDCLSAATGGIGGSAVIWIAVFGVLGFGALSFVWFSSRPLWRHGRGLRLRRLPGIATGWAPRKLS